MEIRVLKYFLSVARNENISKAAEELHLTQPTLSRQLSELEEELGTRLFVRGKRRTTLTEDGIFLKERAKEIVALSDKTVAQFQQAEENIAGDIYIGCGETMAMQEIVKLLAPISQSYPHIFVHLVSGNEERIADMLQKGLADFGVVCRGHAPVEYVYRELPHRDRWGILLNRRHPLADRKAISREDLLQEPLVVSRQNTSGSQLEHWLKKPLGDLNIVATYNLLHNAAFFAQENMACVLCFEDIVEAGGRHFPDVVFRPLSPQVLSGNYLIWRKNQVFSRAARVALACFETAFGEESNDDS
ncbi:LysR family transcriptional regulator [Anaerovibrio sp.]|uniref:LysR family transcriptional regulator n=1 Tax=Anaerovibrio sp. TaxID=1872532 RepID=UPI003F16549E